MTLRSFLLPGAVLAGLSAPVLAQDADFALTYHVERTPAADLSIDTCGSVVTDAAERAGLRAGSQRFPEQLVTVSGGAEGTGAFVVQCIAVDDKTVTVVQGIDYSRQKGTIGAFADDAFEAVKAAVK